MARASQTQPPQSRERHRTESPRLALQSELVGSDRSTLTNTHFAPRSGAAGQDGSDFGPAASRRHAAGHWAGGCLHTALLDDGADATRLWPAASRAPPPPPLVGVTQSNVCWWPRCTDDVQLDLGGTLAMCASCLRFTWLRHARQPNRAGFSRPDSSTNVWDDRVSGQPSRPARCLSRSPAYPPFICLIW